MNLYVRVTDGCQGCGACLLTCPERAIRPQSQQPAEQASGQQTEQPNGQGSLHGPLLVLDDRCTGCGECVEVCPVDAIVEVAG